MEKNNSKLKMSSLFDFLFMQFGLTDQDEFLAAPEVPGKYAASINS